MGLVELNLQDLMTAVSSVHHDIPLSSPEVKTEWAHPVLGEIHGFFNNLVEYSALERLPPSFRGVTEAKEHEVTYSPTDVELTWGEMVGAEKRQDLVHTVISAFSGKKTIADNYMLRVSYEKREEGEEGIYIYGSHHIRKDPSNWIPLSREQISSDEQHKLELLILKKIASGIDTARRLVETKHRAVSII